MFCQEESIAQNSSQAISQHCRLAEFIALCSQNFGQTLGACDEQSLGVEQPVIVDQTIIRYTVDPIPMGSTGWLFPDALELSIPERTVLDKYLV